MTSVRKAVFTHEFKHDPCSEEAGTIKIKARILRDYGSLTFTTSSFIEEFIDEDKDDCPSKENLNYFLMEAEIDGDIIDDAMMRLILYVDEVTFSISNDYFSVCVLEVWMDFLPCDLGELQFEEAARASMDQINNIQFRPASKLVVKSLTRKIYSKIISLVRDKCAVCLEDFNDGQRLVTLPCGHDFDDQCIVKWFETSHVCPLCRFELPCEDQ